MEAPPSTQHQGNSLQEIFSGCREVLALSLALARALLNALWLLTRITFVGLRLIAPSTWFYAKKAAAAGWGIAIEALDWFSDLPVNGQLAVSSTILSFLVLAYFTWTGKVQRACKASSRRAYHLIRSWQRMWQGVMQAIAVVVPVAFVVLPLRLYLSRELFRRLFNFATVTLSSCSSMQAIYKYYSDAAQAQPTGGGVVGKPVRQNPHNSLLSSVDEGRIAALGPTTGGWFFSQRSWDTSGDPATAEAPTKRSRKTIDTGSLGAGRRGALFPSLFGNDPPPLLPSPESTPGSGGNENDNLAAEDIKVWLDYWVVACAFDLLMLLPLYALRIVFASSDIGIHFMFFGFVHQSMGTTDLDNSYLPQNSPPTIKSRASSTATWLLLWIYEWAYATFLVSVLTRRRNCLTALRKRIVAILNWIVATLVGWRPFPSAPITQTSDLFSGGRKKHSRRRDGRDMQSVGNDAVADRLGLIPELCKRASDLLPAQVAFWLKLLCGVPQLLLLTLPYYLLPLATFSVSILFPLFQSLKALDAGQLEQEVYWLTYFTLKELCEVLLLRRVKCTATWSYLPLVRHIELLLNIGLQTAAICPNVVLTSLMPMITVSTPTTPREGAPPSGRSSTAAPSGSGTVNAPIHIKEEPVSDDDRAQNRAPSDAPRTSLLTFSPVASPTQRSKTPPRVIDQSRQSQQPRILYRSARVSEAKLNGEDQHTSLSSQTENEGPHPRRKAGASRASTSERSADVPTTTSVTKRRRGRAESRSRPNPDL